MALGPGCGLYMPIAVSRPILPPMAAHRAPPPSGAATVADHECAATAPMTMIAVGNWISY